MKQRFILLLFFMFMLFLAASGDNAPSGGRSAAMGHASVALKDLWAVQNNQAGLAYLENTTTGFYYENRFGLKELSLKSFNIAFPSKSGTLAFGVTHTGFSLFSTVKAGLAYSRQFASSIAVGVQLDYYSIHQGDIYGNKQLLTFEGGIMAPVNENLSFGFHVFNPVNVKISDYNNERLPSSLRMGFSYVFSDKLTCVIEVAKSLYQKPEFKAGMEYRLIKEIYLRGGTSTKPGMYTFGAGIYMNNFKFDFASSVHPVLGYSPQVSCTYQFE